jgi:hypothetical protein
MDLCDPLRYFIIDTFHNVEGMPSLLRIETMRETKKIDIPSFLEVFRDVTGKKKKIKLKMRKTIQLPK